MDIIEWDRIWKEIQNDTKEPYKYTNAQILDHWKAPVPGGACLRKGWPEKDGMDSKPHIKYLGSRKVPKPGKETTGEKGLEVKLLAEKGKVKIHYIENDNESLRLQVCFHNMGLGTARGPSQKLIDCFGVINIGDENFPTAIEVKIDNEGPWYAVIENLIQVQMLQQNLGNLQKYFGNPPLAFGTLSRAWGVVLAPENYFTTITSRNNEKSFKRVLDLIEHIRDEVRITLVACDKAAAGVEPGLEESKKPEDAYYWRLIYFGGFWPSKTETLKLS